MVLLLGSTSDIVDAWVEGPKAHADASAFDALDPRGAYDLIAQ